MRTTEILTEEHRWIHTLLECLSKVVEGAIETETLDPRAPELLTLFESFADGSHQLKEERVLFPRLMQRADVAEGELIRKLLGDHGKDRFMMQGMQSNLLGAIYGEPLCLREFVEQASSYVRLHKAHMQSENQSLFQLADRVLTAEDDRDVVVGFEVLEPDGPPGRERLRNRIQALSDHFGLPAEHLTKTEEEAI